jgi:membrane complex biogenesis BtpA family protein
MDLFARHADRPAFVGVVHLLPLPGAPRASPGLQAVLDRAVSDATALAEGGVDALIIENLGDAPFVADEVDRSTVAAMTRIAAAVDAHVHAVPLGVNVLRNDALAALAIAAAIDAAFIRVNVHVGAMLTDQGVITGRARATLLERNRIGARAKIAADVHVKHAVPLANEPIEAAAADLAERGGADAIIVSGAGTGRPTSFDDLRRVRAAAPAFPIWVGSGVVPEEISAYNGLADALIVGTWLHTGGVLAAPIDVQRVRTLRSALLG